MSLVGIIRNALKSRYTKIAGAGAALFSLDCGAVDSMNDIDIIPNYDVPDAYIEVYTPDNGKDYSSDIDINDNGDNIFNPDLKELLVEFPDISDNLENPKDNGNDEDIKGEDVNYPQYNITECNSIFNTDGCMFEGHFKFFEHLAKKIWLEGYTEQEITPGEIPVLAHTESVPDDAPALFNINLLGNPVYHTKLVTTVPFEKISDPDNFVSLNGLILKIFGTSMVDFRVPKTGIYFQNMSHLLIPGESSDMNFKIFKVEGENGIAYVVQNAEQNKGFNLNHIVYNLDYIAGDVNEAVGLEGSHEYSTFLGPNMLLFSLGGEGSFSWGKAFGNIVSINYGGDSFFNNQFQEIMGLCAHEMVHGIQTELDLYSFYKYASFLMEGLANSVAIFIGQRTWGETGMIDLEYFSYDMLQNKNDIHTLGNYVLNAVGRAGYLNKDTLFLMFHPDKEYDFLECSKDIGNALKNQGCVDVIKDFYSGLVGDEKAQELVDKYLLFGMD